MVGTALSSLLSRRMFSRKLGEGARAAVVGAAGGSERLRFLLGVFKGVVAPGGCRTLPESIVQCIDVVGVSISFVAAGLKAI